MEFEINITESINKFSSYFNIINTLPEFKIYQREIKLNTLLENKKIQFEIEDIKSQSPCFFGRYLTPKSGHSILEMSSIKSYDFRINSMIFILKDDDVLKLKCDVSILNSELENLVNSGLKFDLIATPIDRNIVFYLTS